MYKHKIEGGTLNFGFTFKSLSLLLPGNSRVTD